MRRYVYCPMHIQCLALLLLLAPHCADAQEAIGHPDPRAVPALLPERFRSAPAEVRIDLARRGCRIPQNQLSDDARPNNVVTGRFRSANALDWAALCSREHTTFLIVYWNGAAKDPWIGSSSADENWMQWMGPTEGWRYSRSIGTAEPARIRRLNEAFGNPGTLPEPLEHDGIEEAFAGKASIISYWLHDRFVELTGMD